MKNIFRIFLLVPLLLTSCEDFFRTTVEVEPPPYVKGLVVVCYIEDTDSTLMAMVGHNAGSLESIKNPSDLLLPDAVVTLLDERGEPVLMMDTVTPGMGTSVNYIFRLDTAFGSNGRRFTLQVTHPGYGMATAVQTMPYKPEVSQPVFRSQGGYDDYLGYYGVLSFEIKDLPGEENFYRIRVFVEDPKQGYGFYAMLDSDDPLMESSYNESEDLLLQDKTFDGESYPVKVKVADSYYPDEEGFPEGVRVFLDISTVTKDYYLYDKTLKKAQESQDLGFFVEPVQVYDNVQNGFGIFTLSARRWLLAVKE